MFVLSNRCVLYSQLGEDADFYAAATMEGDSVVVASRPGFLYHLNASTRDIKLLTDIGREISCVAYDPSRSLLWIGGEHGCMGYVQLGVTLSNNSAINSNFEGDLAYKGARTEVYSEILAISVCELHLLVIDATGQVHLLPHLELEASEPEHSPALRQINGAIKGLRLINGENLLNATFFTWTGHRVCFLDEQQCVKTIDLEDAENECPEIDCAAFCPKRGLLIIGDNYRTLRYDLFAFRINDRVIDIENEAEIWAEEMESDFEEFDEGYDGSILDLDVQTIDGKSNFSF